ncbi:hypothetical protein LINPERPRIM_LOCUS18669 [Linum perenne]
MRRRSVPSAIFCFVTGPSPYRTSTAKETMLQTIWLALDTTSFLEFICFLFLIVISSTLFVVTV